MIFTNFSFKFPNLIPCNVKFWEYFRNLHKISFSKQLRTSYLKVFEFFLRTLIYIYFCHNFEVQIFPASFSTSLVPSITNSVLQIHHHQLLISAVKQIWIQNARSNRESESFQTLITQSITQDEFSRLSFSLSYIVNVIIYSTFFFPLSL